MSDEAQTRLAPAEPPTQQLLSFITAHFAVFSLLGLVAVVLCSTLFVYGYLREFDSQLIWIIEYTDILKLGLVALALISSAILITIFLVILAIQPFYIAIAIYPALRAREGKIQAALSFILLVIIGLVIFQAIFGWEMERFAAVTRLPSEIFGPLSLSAIFLLISSYFTLRIVQGQGSSRGFLISQLLVFLTVSVGSFGATLGAYTKFSKGGLTHDVFLKDRQMSNVRLVLFTSHHTVVYAGTDVVVLPTSEIMKIVAHPTDQQQRWP
jgi:hypothetical protein